MAKAKEEKKKKEVTNIVEERKATIWQMVVGVIILLVSILFLIAVMGDTTQLIFDYKILHETGLSFFRIIKLDFPPVSNPIGPFGVFFGYWLILIFGKFFSVSLLLGTTMLAFLSVFFRQEKHPFQKTILFLIFAFFLNLDLFVINPNSQNYAGIVPWMIFQFFQRIFHDVGTIIICSVVVVTCLLFIFEVQNVIKFFAAFGKGILKTIAFIAVRVFKIFRFIGRSIVKLFKKREPKEIKPKPSKPKKEKKKKQKKTKEGPFNPNIIDHAAHDENDQPLPKPPKIKRKLTQDKDQVPDEPTREYEKPQIEDFLSSVQASKRDREEIEKNIKRVSRILMEKLAEFGVDAEVINVNIGPIITQYEIKPAPGVKVSKFHALADDLALAIKATSIRIQAPIPGRGLVGIEIPNVSRDTIYLKDILLSDEMKKMDGLLAIGLGKDISGKPVVADLAKMPHLLIAGATGSGKSVCVNSIICSLLFRTTPDEVRLVMIDPKRIELSGYQGIPHLIQEVVTDNEDALVALNWAVTEMDQRYELLQRYKVKDLKAYNVEVEKLRMQDDTIEDHKKPFIIIIVDELADLMMTVGRDIERPITRLAQMARAIGIHLILATQRPSIKVITGVIKANFPSRIAFQVSSKIDSRVIIDSNGAEKLLGMGDSLFLPPGTGETERIHGAFIVPNEIHNLIDYLKVQPKPEQEIKIIEDEETMLGEFDYDDELFPEAAVCVVTAGQASVSMLQRHFKIGYARAGRLVDMLEQAGIIGPHVGSKSREVLASEEDMKIYGYLPD
ncbi:MAG: cell division protein FtsK [Candidatus Cloacimonadota bacterium]|nr:MAG: cell division protein FtsK [Candidatus Cloacimonadota bacterium]